MKKFFILDGMALVYRAHFAFIARPIRTSKGFDTSAIFGFTQTLLDLMKNHQPTHMAVAFDTDAPTQRHKDFAEYKAQREAMPEGIEQALPHIRRLLDAFGIPVVICDGYEADDLIGTLVRCAEKEDFQSYMVTLDKDLGQLVSDKTFLFKVPRMGEGGEIMGVPEVLKRWNIQRPGQVADVLALMGDASDNIPGVPGIGEKTAMKLIGQFDTVENLLAHTGELSGKLKENVEKSRDIALLSKKLAVIDCSAPCQFDPEELLVRPPDDEKLKALLTEFEFNAIGRRLYGNDFKAGRGFHPAETAETKAELSAAERTGAPEQSELIAASSLKTIGDVPHSYQVLKTASERAELIKALTAGTSFAFGISVTSDDAKTAQLNGLAFSLKSHEAFFIPLTSNESDLVLGEFRAVLEDEQIEKVGHDLKFAASVLKWRGISVRGKYFDTMVAHSLIEPDLRHTLEYISEASLGYTPQSAKTTEGRAGSPLPAADRHENGTHGVTRPPNDLFAAVASEAAADSLCERVDVALQLRAVLEPQLAKKKQERVFYEIESPLIPVLVVMEFEGIKVDAVALAEFANQLSREMAEHEREICCIAGTTFNLNSPKQLGQILFDVLKICEAPKKTKTGQYVTDEQTLSELAPDHEIVRRLLEYRGATKLKSTYADALPAAIFPKTQRVHTTYNQVATSTGRLNSQNPNLQNIPIRTERGQEIRKAFVPRDENFLLLSADYSQIELRIIAALSREPGLLEAFQTGVDVHTATAAKVFGVALDGVTAEMRRKAKMVNYGIAYGISSFGLAQRLGIPRKEGAEIIEQYFQKFSGIKQYMTDTVAFARQNGFVETVTGRRRYLPDVRSANGTIRAAAERNAINAPIQGTAADMIKLAMIAIHNEFSRRKLKTRMLLQVHDELVFDLYKPEEKEVMPLVEEKMKSAIALDVPIVVEMGVGKTWLEAH